MKKRQLIELIIAHYVTAIGISLALVTQVASLFMDKVSPFEFSITILLSGLAFYILRGGIETDVVSGLKNRELEKEASTTSTTTITIEEEMAQIRARLKYEVGVSDEETLNKMMKGVEEYLHNRPLMKLCTNERGFFANNFVLNDLEELLKLKEYGTLEDDKVILETTKRVLAHFERILKFCLCDNKIKIEIKNDTGVSVN